MTLDWQGAAAEARGLAAGWTGEPGGAFVLFDTEAVRETVTGGLASLEHGIPFTADTPSRYASISKHFLAATLLLHGFDLEAPLAAWLPDLPDAIGAVTLGSALTMTGGLPDMMEVLWQQGAVPTATLSAEDVMAAVRRLPGLCAPPGTEMAYSNTGWRLAQRALEARLGRQYGAVLQEALLGPVGAAIAFPYDETEVVPGLATGYWRDGGAWRRGRYGLHISASGGLAGSANALARWCGGLMAGHGPLGGMLDRLLTPRALLDGTPSAYRLGLVEKRLGATRLAAHGGSLPGYRNHVLMAPDLGVGVILLLNREEDPLLPAMRVMAALLREPFPAAPTLQGGLYAADTGPFWAALHPDAIEFMGSRETLLADGGFHRSVPGALEVGFRLEGEVIDGRFGGVTRRLRRVPDGQPLDASLVGTWRETTFGAALLIRADGTARWPFAGGLGQEITLTPLPGARAIAAVPHGPGTHRSCLWLDGDRLNVASHRSRVLSYAPDPSVLV